MKCVADSYKPSQKVCNDLAEYIYNGNSLCEYHLIEILN